MLFVCPFVPPSPPPPARSKHLILGVANGAVLQKKKSWEHWFSVAFGISKMWRIFANHWKGHANIQNLFSALLLHKIISMQSLGCGNQIEVEFDFSSICVADKNRIFNLTSFEYVASIMVACRFPPTCSKQNSINPNQSELGIQSRGVAHGYITGLVSSRTDS